MEMNVTVNTANPTSYNIKLPQFEGPFDLLLFFIQRDEIEIHDIPIAKLTNDFLAYIKQMEHLNIELASEFILVAASLMRIKAKMLLPRQELDEAGEAIDPRAELVQKLLEYKRFKAVVVDLKVMEEERALRFGRGQNGKEMRLISNKFSTESDLEAINLYKLLKVFKKVLTRLEDSQRKTEYSIVKHPFTIAQQKEFILQHFANKKGKTNFEGVFRICESRIEAIFRFLAILEMMQQQLIYLQIGLGMNNFWLMTKEEGKVIQEAMTPNETD